MTFEKKPLASPTQINESTVSINRERDLTDLQTQVTELQAQLATLQEALTDRETSDRALRSLTRFTEPFGKRSLAGFRDLGLLLYVLLFPFRLSYKICFAIFRWLILALNWLRDWRVNIPSAFWSCLYGICHFFVVSSHRPIKPDNQK